LGDASRDVLTNAGPGYLAVTIEYKWAPIISASQMLGV
jgi:hypothetical protein